MSSLAGFHALSWPDTAIWGEFVLESSVVEAERMVSGISPLARPMISSHTFTVVAGVVDTVLVSRTC